MRASDSHDVGAPGAGGGKRVFFALWPDESAARRLHDAGRALQHECGGRAMRRETLHLTLAFIGEVAGSRLDALIELGARLPFAPHRLCLDQLGSWRHNRLAWAGSCKPPTELAEMVETLHAWLREAGFPIEKRPFAPHVTLVRRLERGFPPRGMAPIDWPVSEFRLVASERRAEGAHYRPLGRWPANLPPAPAQK